MPNKLEKIILILFSVFITFLSLFVPLLGDDSCNRGVRGLPISFIEVQVFSSNGTPVACSSMSNEPVLYLQTRSFYDNTASTKIRSFVIIVLDTILWFYFFKFIYNKYAK